MKIEFPVFVFASFTAQHPYRSILRVPPDRSICCPCSWYDKRNIPDGESCALAVEDLILTTIGIFADAS